MTNRSESDEPKFTEHLIPGAVKQLKKDSITMFNKTVKLNVVPFQKCNAIFINDRHK